jgi:ABC-type Fe3+/spermidine/putrescine transport system ATPase subunit
LHQVGKPEDIYDRPVSSFVASFVGEANMFEASVIAQCDGKYRVALGRGGGEFAVSGPPGLRVGTDGTVVIRPEHVTVVGTRPGGDARLRDVAFAGATRHATFSTASGPVLASISDRAVRLSVEATYRLDFGSHGWFVPSSSSPPDEGTPDGALIFEDSQANGGIP